MRKDAENKLHLGKYHGTEHYLTEVLFSGFKINIFQRRIFYGVTYSRDHPFVSPQTMSFPKQFKYVQAAAQEAGGVSKNYEAHN